MEKNGYTLKQVVQTIVETALLRASEEEGRTYTPPGM
jgi:hypothetical protein